jgi:DNA-binding PucR family transcriptional regulator
LSAEREVAGLIAAQTRAVLVDPTLRATLEAFSQAILNVATAAQLLSVHPNTMRYRLGRITELSGRDPRVTRDLMELTAASQVLGLGGEPVTHPGARTRTSGRKRHQSANAQ